jgi:tripartite-type tricarboxylate transporter receptor subunit TctC
MTHPTRRNFIHAGAGAALLASIPCGARAQMTPDNLRIQCGYPPGSPPDVVARHVGDKLAGVYAKTVVIDNKTGAAGRLAVEACKAARADGATMLLTPASVFTMYPFIYKQLSYEPQADFVPVSLGADFSHALAVGPLVPESVKTVRGFIAWCKQNPDKSSCGNPGAGSLPHFVAVLMAREAGLDLNHIAYRGTGPAMQDVLAGQVAAVMGPEGNYLPHVASGRLRVVALTDTRRSPYLPEVGTFKEQGFKSIELREWFGFFMPKGTPASQVEHCASSIASALRSPEVVQSFAQLGMSATSSTPAQLSAKVASELAYWRPVLKDSGFSAES